MMKFTVSRGIGQGLGKVVYTFNPKTCEFEANLLYIISSRPAWATTYQEPSLNINKQINKLDENTSHICQWR